MTEPLQIHANIKSSNGNPLARRALTAAVAKLLESAMRHPVFGRSRDAYRPSTTDAQPDGLSPATLRELQDGKGLFDRFGDRLTPNDLRGKDVLDLGSGYGGRAIYYMRHGLCRSVIGLEINARKAAISKSGACALEPSANLQFTCGVGEALPFAADQFDVILSYDVFEHVQDLRRVLLECHRVLRPGGRLYSLFPPYYGPRAHHLDFITTLQFLHHFIPTPLLVDAANVVIRRHPELERNPLPSVNRYDPLPTLNGTTERRFRRLVADCGWRVIDISLVAIGWNRPGGGGGLIHRFAQSAIDRPWPFTRDLLTSTVRSILEKPASHLHR